MARHLPVSPAALTEHLLEAVLAAPVPGRALRVLVDGAPATDPHGIADALVDPLRTRSRPPLRIRSDSFWRDASLRLEWGREDEQSYFDGWLDTAALRREVLDPLGPGGDGSWLPSLRDPVTNRSTRAPREAAPPGAVLLLSGPLLLVPGPDGTAPLPADLVVHLTASPAALARRTPPAEAWTLPVFARYEREVDPAARADVVVRVEDPRHPALLA